MRVGGEKVCMCVSSVAIEAAVTGPQCKGGRTPGRFEMYKGVQCIMKISPLFVPPARHSEVSEMKGEFQVKGGKRDTSTSLCRSFPFLLSSQSWIFKWVWMFLP